MAKPILVVRLGGYTRKLSRDKIKEMNTGLMEQFPDYNILFITEEHEENARFEVFNVQDYPQIQFDQLKEKIESYAKTV